jgi:hypothetical protein
MAVAQDMGDGHTRGSVKGNHDQEPGQHAREHGCHGRTTDDDLGMSGESTIAHIRVRLAEQDRELKHLRAMRDGTIPEGAESNGPQSSPTHVLRVTDDVGQMDDEHQPEDAGVVALTDRQKRVGAWALILERRLTNMMEEDTYVEVGMQAVLDEAAYLMRSFLSEQQTRDEMARRMRPKRATKQP